MTRQDYRSYLRADVEIVPPKLENKENVQKLLNKAKLYTSVQQTVREPRE